MIYNYYYCDYKWAFYMRKGVNEIFSAEKSLNEHKINGL